MMFLLRLVSGPLAPYVLGVAGIAFLALGGQNVYYRLSLSSCESKVTALQNPKVDHEANEKIVVQYVDRIREVNAPVAAVRERVTQRLCADRDPSVPGSTAVASAQASAPAGDPWADSFAAELKACAEQREQLDALIDWVKLNGG